jgi:uncharacterized protein (TIGR03032 family)
VTQFEALWTAQSDAMRQAEDVLLQDPTTIFPTSESLEYSADSSFIELLSNLNISLILSREYEHLLVGLSAQDGRLRQSHQVIPHPTGLAVSPDKESLFVASTRNPNQIWEFKPCLGHLSRKKSPFDVPTDSFRSLLPFRTRFLPGAQYIHDIAFIGKRLYANSVSQNAIIEIDFESSSANNHIVWWPKSIEDEESKPDYSINYLQLNSIAAGVDLESSYFSASCAKPGPTLPGSLEFEVDKRGVVFQGKSRDVIATGLTRPHSARFYQGNLWIDNSGYGEVGLIKDGQFQAKFKLPGWTRGLCFVKNVMFVGVSRVLSKFSSYAPGIKNQSNIECSVYAIDLTTEAQIGSIRWPAGNQIFAIEAIDVRYTPGFACTDIKNKNQASSVYFSYLF